MLGIACVCVCVGICVTTTRESCVCRHLCYHHGGNRVFVCVIICVTTTEGFVCVCVCVGVCGWCVWCVCVCVAERVCVCEILCLYLRLPLDALQIFQSSFCLGPLIQSTRSLPQTKEKGEPHARRWRC